ncbi:MAG: glycosyltransferase family 2 protein, partial [Bryobacteraceae bacterium]
MTALSPVLAVIAALALALADLAFALFGRRKHAPDTAPYRDTASIVIPNWNGRELLEEFLPSVIAADGAYEVIVVDFAWTDGS